MVDIVGGRNDGCNDDIIVRRIDVDLMMMIQRARPDEFAPLLLEYSCAKDTITST